MDAIYSYFDQVLSIYLQPRVPSRTQLSTSHSTIATSHCLPISRLEPRLDVVKMISTHHFPTQNQYQQPYYPNVITENHHNSQYQHFSNVPLHATMVKRMPYTNGPLAAAPRSQRDAMSGRGSASGPVRRRISRACDQCNQLRTKCDGSTYEPVVSFTSTNACSAESPCAHCMGT